MHKDSTVITLTVVSELKIKRWNRGGSIQMSPDSESDMINNPTPTFQTTTSTNSDTSNLTTVYKIPRKINLHLTNTIS